MTTNGTTRDAGNPAQPTKDSSTDLKSPVRRSLLMGSAGLAALSVGVLAGCGGGGSGEGGEGLSQAMSANLNLPEQLPPNVVRIVNGLIRGETVPGTSPPQSSTVVFRGIPYGGDAGGANRWLPPQPVQNWNGIRDALIFGASSIQASSGGAAPPANTTSSEDCLFLNVYTPSLNRAAGRPVMVWIHGGGFRSGSGSLSGAALAAEQDVVVVTVNHRLNAFGFLPIGNMAQGPAHRTLRAANNCGLLDIIQVLEWVKANIEGFGGNPGNVTLIGQSGGGSKCHVIGLMPESEGLYHKLINMSGASVWETDDEESWRPVMDSFLANLGMGLHDMHRLREFGWRDILLAHGAAVRANHTDDFRPTVDHRYVSVGPLTPAGLRKSPHLPMLMGNCESEAVAFLPASARNVNESQLLGRIAAQYNLSLEGAAEIVAGYRQDPRNVTPWQVLRQFATDEEFRLSQVQAGGLLGDARNAPVYYYNFTFATSPEPGVSHGADVPYAFGNLTGSTAADPLANETRLNMMAAFAAFARTGSPNNPRMPDWPRYDTARRATMVINSSCQVVDDFRGTDRITGMQLFGQKTFELFAGPLSTGIL